MISDQTYLNWQKKLTDSPAFRGFWKFWGIYSVILIFIIGAYLLFIGQWREVIITLAAFVLARLIISPLIYVFYKKERPYQILHFIPVRSVLFSEPTSKHNSFPSDHAISFAAITTALWWYFPVLGMILVIVTLLNGMARIVMGYHYISHLVAGWLVGIISALAVIYWLAPLLFTH